MLIHWRTKWQFYTNARGRPVVADQSTGSANSLEQYKRTEDTYYSWQWDFFGPENWRKATTKKVLMGRGGVGERAWCQTLATDQRKRLSREQEFIFLKVTEKEDWNTCFSGSWTLAYIRITWSACYNTNVGAPEDTCLTSSQVMVRPLVWGGTLWEALTYINLSFTDILGQIILVRDYPAHCRMFSNTPDVHPLNASSTSCTCNNEKCHQVSGKVQ